MNTKIEKSKKNEINERSKEKMKLSKEDMKELMTLKNLTVAEFLEKVKDHPKLSLLLTTAGFWFLGQFLFFLFVAINVVYAASRVFKLVLG